MKSDVLRVGGLRVPVHVGWTDAERGTPQDLDVTLEIHLHTRVAAATDDLSATVDYAKAAEAAVASLRARPFRLLETAAEDVAASVLAMGARRVTVTLRKRGRLHGLDADYAEIIVTRP